MNRTSKYDWLKKKSKDPTPVFSRMLTRKNGNNQLHLENLRSVD